MTRIVIIDDDPLVRSGLRMIIESADDLTIVGEGGDGAEAVGLVREFRPDVVLMDIRMPAVDGLAATALVRAEPEPPQVIVLTTFDLDDYVMRALRPARPASCSRTRRRGSCSTASGWSRRARPCCRPA